MYFWYFYILVYILRFFTSPFIDINFLLVLISLWNWYVSFVLLEQYQLVIFYLTLPIIIVSILYSFSFILSILYHILLYSYYSILIILQYICSFLIFNLLNHSSYSFCVWICIILFFCFNLVILEIILLILLISDINGICITVYKLSVQLYFI